VCVCAESLGSIEINRVHLRGSSSSRSSNAQVRSVPPHRMSPRRAFNGNPEDASRSSASFPCDRRFASRCAPLGFSGSPVLRSPASGGSRGFPERGALARSRGASHVITRTPLVIDAPASAEGATKLRGIEQRLSDLRSLRSCRAQTRTRWLIRSAAIVMTIRRRFRSTNIESRMLDTCYAIVFVTWF